MKPGPAVFWTAEHIIDALQRWTREHGSAPSARAWMCGVPGYPTAVTVRKRFGTFGNARDAAGVTFARKNGLRPWTRDEIAEAIFQWKFTHGRLPLFDEWATNIDGFPTAEQVRSSFGSWNAGMVAAGYVPRHARRSTRGYRAQMAHVTKAAA